MFYEIATCRQFHQRFKLFFRTKVLFSSYVFGKKALLYEKRASNVDEIATWRIVPKFAIDVETVMMPLLQDLG